AGVEPARALLAEHDVPVDLARLELRDRGVPAVRAPQGRAHAVAALGEVQAVADGASHAVVLDPDQVRLVDPALVDEVLHQAADGVVDQRRHQRRLQAEAALEPARDVVLAAAFPDLEAPRGVDAALAGIQAEHHLAQAHQVPPTARPLLDLQLGHGRGCLFRARRRLSTRAVAPLHGRGYRPRA